MTSALSYLGNVEASGYTDYYQNLCPNGCFSLVNIIFYLYSDFQSNERLIQNSHKHVTRTKERLGQIRRVHSLVVSDLRSETKGSRFESGCRLCAEVSSL